MKLKVIGKNEIPQIENEDIERVDYNLKGLFIYIVGVNKLNDRQYVRITLDFGNIWHFRVGDEGEYLNWENDFPTPKTPEWKEYSQNYIFEFFETDYQEWFKYSSAGVFDDSWVRHFCVATRNDIVDVISNSGPTIKIEYIDKKVYDPMQGHRNDELEQEIEELRKYKAEQEKKEDISPEEFEEFKKWKKQQDEFEAWGF
ncbi:MAG: hypothetical protein LBI13_03280 [Streptococcaceae bacterium]|jgi:hypothetical protein|nr:hypothetical protein [Streptococcaceae bacterium]